MASSSDEYAERLADELCPGSNSQWHLVARTAQRAYVAGMQEVIATYRDQQPDPLAALLDTHRNDLGMLAEMIAQRVAMNAWATVPAQLTELLRPGGETHVPLYALAYDQACNLHMVISQEGRGLVLAFYWHGNERLAAVHLQSRPESAL